MVSRAIMGMLMMRKTFSATFGIGPQSALNLYSIAAWFESKLESGDKD
jgi:hypothetical protein